MNKTIALAAIVMVAVVMGMSVMAPAYAGQGSSSSVNDRYCEGLDRALDRLVNRNLLTTGEADEILDDAGCAPLGEN